MKMAAAAVAALLVAAPLGAAGSNRSATAASGAPEAVIVRGVPGAAGSVAAAVQRLGGTVGRQLHIIDGVSAKLPASKVAQLRATPGIAAVTPDAKGHFLGSDYTNGDLGSPASVQSMINVPKGTTGKGVDVAIIDSGVTPVPGLDARGKVVDGPDLSFDSQNAGMEHLDAFGHGTFMAGLIAAKTPGAGYDGVAPDARLVNVKVGAADGTVDVSQVLAAIDWVVQHRTDNGLNIRVLNLSYGTDSTQSYVADPLAYAAEVAWRNGIVVVAAGGNDGRADKTIADPAFDPYVIAVGAQDPNGTLATGDDVVAPFSSRGSSTRHVDVVAPGSHVIGLRVPGSYIDVNYPTGRVGKNSFRGSGTSEATAVVSGAVALLLQQRPDLTPDQVKALLGSTAKSLPGGPNLGGAGLINVEKAGKAPRPNAHQTWPTSTGLGSLELARGTGHVSNNGVMLSGERDIFGNSFSTAVWAPAALAGSTWSGGDWNGSTWSGSTWSGSTWSGSTWSGSTWSGSTWSGSTWSGSTWSGSTWSGSTWSGSTWSGSTWSGSTWSGSTWS
jgi:serine protease AprX